MKLQNVYQCISGQIFTTFFFPNQENMINVPIQNSVFEWVTRLKYKKIEISFNPGQPRSLLEKAMAAHSSTLVWKIPWAGEPGRLQSMGSLLVGHNWATSLSLFTSMHWRRKWQPTPVFLPGESQGGEAWLAAVYGVAGHDWSDLAA